MTTNIHMNINTNATNTASKAKTEANNKTTQGKTTQPNTTTSNPTLSFFCFSLPVLRVRVCVCGPTHYLAQRSPQPKSNPLYLLLFLSCLWSGCEGKGGMMPELTGSTQSERKRPESLSGSQ